MKVKDALPEKLLVNTASLKAAISESNTQNRIKQDLENSKAFLLGLIGILASCLLTLIPSWSFWNVFLKVTISTATAIVALLICWFFSKYLQARKEVNITPFFELYERIVTEAKREIRYTALIVICYQKVKTGEVKFMTEKRGNYLIHCDIDLEMTIEEQKSTIINYLASTYSVPTNQVVDIFPLSQELFFSIKPIHNVETQNGFVFYQVKLKRRSKQRLLNHKDTTWKTIQEMEASPELMGKNQDIVFALNENKTKISDSFEDSYGPIHIIWNITKKCPYNCAICATKDDSREELNTDQKLQVFNHIFSIKEKIAMLDFAGGDPMIDSGIRTVVLQAIHSLGEEHVSVTTTGRGIQSMENMADEDVSMLLKKCEVTIDASHQNLLATEKEGKFPRKSPEYCSHNFTQIQNAAENIQHLMINIPLIDDDLSDVEIANLISKLKSLKDRYSEIAIEAQIIRLMPVGAFQNNYDEKTYKEYQPLDAIHKVKKEIEKIGIACRYHCSLRVLPALGACDGRCGMLEKKVGIDCSGNVFACTWGAYLHLSSDQDVSENPFYLGNLLTSTLRDILDGKKSTLAHKRLSTDIGNGVAKPYCEAISWFFSKIVGENHDPLSK